MSKLAWDLYKKDSGKWKYGGESELTLDFSPWDKKELISRLALGQKEVVIGCFYDDGLALVVRDIEDYPAAQKYQFYGGLIYL